MSMSNDMFFDDSKGAVMMWIGISIFDNRF